VTVQYRQVVSSPNNQVHNGTDPIVHSVVADYSESICLKNSAAVSTAMVLALVHNGTDPFVHSAFADYSESI
jgi:hypothetical protein